MIVNGRGWLRLAVLFLLLVPLTACGNDDDEVANDRLEVPEITPKAADELSGGIETASLEITDGAFGVDELILQRGEPTDLEITNNDDVAYQFAIEDLVTAQDIPADDAVEIGFTTPDPGTYTGQLLDADDGTAIDDVRVRVLETGGAG